MTGRLSITTKDLRRVLDLTDLSIVDEPGRPLPWSLLTGLADLVGCDSVTYESHDVASRFVRHYQVTAGAAFGSDFTDESVQASFWDLYWRGLCNYWPRTGDFSAARRMLAEPEWLSWQGSAYGEWVRGVGVRGEITIAFPPVAGLQYRLLLWRFTGRDFTERDCLLLTLLHPRLVALHAAALRRQAGVVELTTRQWQLMELMAAGHTNRQIASRLKLSEGTVRTHCENIFQRLQVTNRVAAVAKAFPWETTAVTPDLIRASSTT
jgi:DNA-binding CsgD family transcriptional regulator